MMNMNVKSKVLKDDNELQKFIILLASAAGGKPIKGNTKLQKILFLLSNSIDDIREYGDFDAYLYGPYSETIDQELQYLGQIGVLSNTRGEIALTETGKEIAKDMTKNTAGVVLKALIKYKEIFNDLTNKELLAYVYSAYPDMAKESVEYENLRPNMEDHIMSLVKKHKISAQRAAELIKKPQTYVIKRMKDYGIPILG